MREKPILRVQITDILDKKAVFIVCAVKNHRLLVQGYAFERIRQ